MASMKHWKKKNQAQHIVNFSVKSLEKIYIKAKSVFFEWYSGFNFC